MKKLILLIILLLLLLPLYSPGKSEKSIKKAGIDELLSYKMDSGIRDFRSLLKIIERRSGNEHLLNSIRIYLQDQKLTVDERINIYRLLGIYARLRYKDAILNVLEKMVSINTVKQIGIPQHRNPKIIKFGKLIRTIAGRFGLRFRNIGNRIFEVSIRGRGRKNIGIYTHCDVVPVKQNEWILKDGTKIDPFRMNIIKGKIYGRGTLDDKSSIAAALFAMRSIRESGLRHMHGIKLIIETTEETGGSGFNYYKKRNRVPEYNIVLDNKYPVVTAEKGFGEVNIKFNSKRTSGRGPEIISFEGAKAVNQIPRNSTAIIKTGSPSKLAGIIRREAKKYISENGNNFSIITETRKNSVKVVVTGRSAHSSEPELGLNPVPRMFSFIHKILLKYGFRKNRYSHAARFIHDLFGTGFYGKRMGIAYSDRFMGPLTISVTSIRNTKGSLAVGINLRMPRGKSRFRLKKEISGIFKRYRRKTGIKFRYSMILGSYFMRRGKKDYIDIFTNIFRDITGSNEGPQSSAGATTARQLPNGVSFGPAYPGEKYRGHGENEYQLLERLYLDMQMVTEMMMRVGNY